MVNLSLRLKVVLSVCLMLYGTSHISSLVTPQDHEQVIEPRAIIEGEPHPPCVRNICPLGITETSPGLKNVVAANKSEPITKPTHPKTHQTAPVTCGDTGLPPPCGDTTSIDTKNQSTLPNTHQTAPVKCGDTGLPPPCGNLTSYSTTKDSTPTMTHQSASVKAIEAREIVENKVLLPRETGLPPPACGSAIPCRKKKTTKKN
ncbi:secreted protein [Melampsora americana]|nr:secreted protein [Melampsora americana]